MKRTPIIVAGQVYLHNDLNEYVVITKSTRGDIQYAGVGFSGANDIELFLKRFSPVDPRDLDQEDAVAMKSLLTNAKTPLSIGWVTREDDEFDTDDEEEFA